MTNSNGRGRSDQQLTPPLWRGVYKQLISKRDRIAFLHRNLKTQCSYFLNGHPLRMLVEAKELFNAVLDRLISCPTIASPAEVDRFLSENGDERAIRRMVRWATRPMPLLGLSQKIAGRRWEQPWSTDTPMDVLDSRVCLDTDMLARRTELTRYLWAYMGEIGNRLDEADREAHIALRQIMTLLEQRGLDLSDEPAKRLGMFEELPFGAIRDLVNADGACPQWTYETARNACVRLATADRTIRKDADRAGFGEGPEALLGYLRLCIKTQSPGGGGIILPLVGEEIKS